MVFNVIKRYNTLWNIPYPFKKPAIRVGFLVKKIIFFDPLFIPKLNLGMFIQ